MLGEESAVELKHERVAFVQVPFGALSDSTRAALTTGLECTNVEKQIENEGDDAVYALLPEVPAPPANQTHSENCHTRARDASANSTTNCSREQRFSSGREVSHSTRASLGWKQRSVPSKSSACL